MGNSNEEIIEDEDEIVDEDEEKNEEDEVNEDEDVDDDDIDWKAEAIKAKGIAKRNATKLAKLKKANQPKKTEKKSGELGYGELGYLVAKGIEDDEEIELVQDLMKRTGEDLKTTVNDDYFKSKLEKMREKKKVDKALPKNGRAGTTTRDTVDYWIKKGELPTDVKLRRKVVNAKIQQKKEGDKFTKNAVVA